MGGIHSELYAKFEKKYVESFLQIRNKMNYILGLMYLMINAGISDLKYEHHQNVLRQLYERFHPEMDN